LAEAVTSEWLPETPALPWRPDVAAAMTADSDGNGKYQAPWYGWRLVPAAGSGYPAVWAFTLPGLLRRLAAAATPSYPAEL
jgi:hypothetical protein